MPTETDEQSIGVTAFKAQCLSLIEDVARGKTRRVVLLKHNRPVAAIVPIRDEAPELWGAMRGTVATTSDVDLTLPTEEVWDADS